MAEQKIGQMVFSVVEGGEVTIVFPHPLTLETIAELEEFFAIMFRGMRRTALQAQQAIDAATEYASWVPTAAGVHGTGVNDGR